MITHADTTLEEGEILGNLFRADVLEPAEFEAINSLVDRFKDKVSRRNMQIKDKRELVNTLQITNARQSMQIKDLKTTGQMITDFITVKGLNKELEAYILNNR